MPNPDTPLSAETKVRLALLHGIPIKWDIEANFVTFLGQLDKASRQAADIFVTPECWLDGYAAADEISTPDKLRRVAQDPRESAICQRVAAEAKKRSMYLCFGFTSLENGQIFNAAGLWDGAGELVGLYHKTHIQTHDTQFTPGEGLPVWPSKWGKLGMMICADRRWPETARSLRLQGAKLILNPTYGFYNDLNEAMMRTRSFENQCFIAFAHPRLSLVTNPKGAVIAKEYSDEPGVTFCDIDLAEAKDDNHLRDRRPEIYRPITHAH